MYDGKKTFPVHTVASVHQDALVSSSSKVLICCSQIACNATKATAWKSELVLFGLIRHQKALASKLE